MRQLLRDDKAQGATKTGITLVVTVTVAVIVGAVLLPVAIDEIEGQDTDVFTQDTGATIEVNGELNSTLDSVDGTVSPSTATFTLNDTRTSSTTTKTIANGSTADFSLEGGTVTVGVENVDSGNNQATANYTYDRDYAYSDGASSIWGILGLAMVLAMFLYVLNLARDSF